MGLEILNEETHTHIVVPAPQPLLPGSHKVIKNNTCIALRKEKWCVFLIDSG